MTYISLMILSLSQVPLLNTKMKNNTTQYNVYLMSDQQSLFSTESVVSSTGAKKMSGWEIHTNCSILPLKYIEDRETLIFTFANKKGEIIDKWLEDPKNPTQFEDRETGKKQSFEEAYKREVSNSLRYLIEIANLLGEEPLTGLSGATFKEYILKAKAILDPLIAKTDKKFNVKVNETSTGNPTLPYKPFGFVELYVEGKDTKLKFTTKELKAKSNPTSKTDSPIVQKKDLGNVV